MNNIYTTSFLAIALFFSLGIRAQVSLESTPGIKIEATGGIELHLDGDFKNQGSLIPSQSTILLDGTGDQELRNDNGAFHKLKINKPAGQVNLNSHINISGGALSLEVGDVELKGYNIILDALAMLIETAGHTVKGASGTIHTTRTLTAPDEDVAGLGLKITSNSNLGPTQIIRGHGQKTGGGAVGIQRFFEVIPTNNTSLDATLEFRYDESELNGQNEADFQLFHSIDGGNTWSLISSSNNTSNNTVTASGIDEMGLFTLSDACMEAIGSSQAICMPITIELDENGAVSINPEEIDGGSKGRCGIANLSLNITDFSCEDAGDNLVTLTLTSATGEISTCNTIVEVVPGENLPGGWNSNDIGSTTVGNDFSFDPCESVQGEFVITGSGNNATSTSTDNVAFASQTLCGDLTLTAKIESVSPGGYGGLMIRETTDANSKQVSVFSNLSNVLRHETRYMPNTNKVVQSFIKPSPYWLRLDRQGNWIFAYYSSTGMPNTFQYVHGVYVPMQTCVEVGLASFTYLPNTQVDAIFSNVTISGGNGGMAVDNDAITTPAPQHSTTIIQNKLHLYPNPNNGNFTLQLDQAFEKEVQLALYNQYGQIIEKKILPPQSKTIEWNISAVSAGPYFMHLTAEGISPQVKAFVVQP